MNKTQPRTFMRGVASVFGQSEAHVRKAIYP